MRLCLRPHMSGRGLDQLPVCPLCSGQLGSRPGLERHSARDLLLCLGRGLALVRVTPGVRLHQTLPGPVGDGRQACGATSRAAGRQGPAWALPCAPVPPAVHHYPPSQQTPEPGRDPAMGPKAAESRPHLSPEPLHMLWRHRCPGPGFRLPAQPGPVSRLSP